MNEKIYDMLCRFFWGHWCCAHQLLIAPIQKLKQKCLRRLVQKVNKSGQKIPGSKVDWALIYCRSKYALAWMGQGPSLYILHIFIAFENLEYIVGINLNIIF